MVLPDLFEPTQLLLSLAPNRGMKLLSPYPHSSTFKKSLQDLLFLKALAKILFQQRATE